MIPLSVYSNNHEAMELYGKAYKLDPDVESHIDYEKLRQPQVQSNISHSKEDADFEAAKFDIKEPDHLKDLAETLTEYQPLDLEDQVLLKIIKYAGLNFAPTTDIIGQACKKLYVLTRNPVVWRHLVELAEAGPRPSIPLDGKYLDYRVMFLLRPRMRTDGVYIAKITYFRPGYSDTSFTNPVHLVTYYRYLRFFGASEAYKVWWLVSSKPPKEVLELLRNPYERKATEYLTGERSSHGIISNIFQGDYQRSEANEKIFHLNLRNVNKSDGMSWMMEVELQYPARMPAHRHAIIRCTRYQPLSGEQYPIDISEWGRFFFSKVRSYQT